MLVCQFAKIIKGTKITDNDCMCKKCLLQKYKKKILKTDEITKDLFEEEFRYQWKNKH